MSIRSLSNEISRIVEEISESVASVITTTLSIDSFLRPVPLRSVGSAFAISNDGYFVTNSHVVYRAESIKLFLKERIVDAHVQVLDPSRGIALIEVLQLCITYDNIHI